MPDPLALGRRELSPSQFIPYFRHVDETTVSLVGRQLLSIIELDGLAFETADTRDVNAHHRGLNTLWKNVADDAVMVWSIVLRRRTSGYPDAQFESIFGQNLDDRYRQRMDGEELYCNRLLLAVLRQDDFDADATTARFFGGKTNRGMSAAAIDADHLKKHKETTLALVAGLESIGARLLRLYEHDGLIYSELSEILHQLLGGRCDRVPLTDGPVWSAIYQDRIVFGRETAEIRFEDRSRYAAIFGLKEYPSVTQPSMFDGLLTAPFELTAVQSFRFVAKAHAREIMGRKANQMVSAQDRAQSQVAELGLALDQLEGNQFVLGEHHMSVAIFADDTKTLADRMARARGFLTSGGAVVTREDLGLEAAWWAQLPGNAKYRARSGHITSRNFSSLSPFHGFPSGRRDGNVWGSAVAMLKTSSGAPYHFNFHHGDLGNTFICGPSGSGKTVILNFLLCQLLKHQPRIVLFDKDRGSELFVRAVGGTYLTLQSGKPSGCAPLKALDLDDATVVWLARWIEDLAGGDITPQERAAIPQAIQALRILPKQDRDLGGLRAYLDTTEAAGLSVRLKRWQQGEPLGWVFDGDHDDIGLGSRIVAYDMTEFLDNPEIRGPLMAYLFRRVESLINGERLLIAIDEFWKALSDHGFQSFVQDRLKTIRKQNGLIVFATQSPRDALMSPIAHSIIEQCATQVFLPNGRGDRRDYVEGMKLTEKEFALVCRDLAPSSRRFLIKQGHASVVAELNLGGFDDELAILSGRTAAVALLDQLRQEVGDDPARWLEAFHTRRKAA